MAPQAGMRYGARTGSGAATSSGGTLRSTSMDEMDGEDLFIRYRDSGDEHALSALYDIYARRLFASGVRFFRRRFGLEGARSLAFDAAHETWLRVIRSRDQWSGSAGSLAAWVTAIHYRCAMELVRRAPAGAGLPEGAPAADPERRLLARKALEAFIERAHPEEMQVLMAYYLTEDSRHVRESLGISPAALRKRVERIKSALRIDPVLGEFLDALGILRSEEE